MDRTTLSFLAIGIIVAFVFFAVSSAFLGGVKNTIKDETIIPGNSDFQIIRLSAQGINYTPDQFTVKVNQPVKLIADVPNLQGCLRSFTIPQLGIQKVFSDNDNSLEFTPTKKGTFDFSCFMGMGKGKITVI